MSALLGKSLNKANDSRILDNSVSHASNKKSLWSKYTNHHSGPLNRAYSLALTNTSRAVGPNSDKPRPPTMINCVKTIIEQNNKRRLLITPDNAMQLFGTNIVINPQGKQGYGATLSMVKILRPQPKRHPKPVTEEAKQKLL